MDVLFGVASNLMNYVTLKGQEAQVGTQPLDALSYGPSNYRHRQSEGRGG